MQRPSTSNREMCYKIKMMLLNFWKKDINSRICAGIKSITRNKVKKQKNFLCDTIAKPSLFSSQEKFSYAKFCVYNLSWLFNPITKTETHVCVQCTQPLSLLLIKPHAICMINGVTKFFESAVSYLLFIIFLFFSRQFVEFFQIFICHLHLMFISEVVISSPYKSLIPSPPTSLASTVIFPLGPLLMENLRPPSWFCSIKLSSKHWPFMVSNNSQLPWSSFWYQQFWKTGVACCIVNNQ